MLRSYRRNDNFNQGDFRKLFTLDTPHTGSPLADLLVSLRGGPGGAAFLLLAIALDKPIHLGAIDDLRNHSPAISEITATPVPSHALVGVGGSDVLEAIPGELGDLYRIVTFFIGVRGDELFEEGQHDAIVGRRSQEGGLSPNAYTVIGGGDGIHVPAGPLGPGNTASPIYSDRLFELIDTPATDIQFEEFPPPASLRVGEERPQWVPAIRGVAEGTLAITSPADQTVVEPGELLPIVVEPSAGLELTELLVVLPGEAVKDTPPFDLQVTIPETLLGPIELLAAGKTAAGEIVLSEPITLVVQPQAVVEAVRIEPRAPVLRGLGAKLDLSLLASYSDGVTRDITDVDSGVELASSDRAIVAVSGGTLTSRALGAGLEQRGARRNEHLSAARPRGTSLPESQCRDCRNRVDQPISRRGVPRLLLRGTR